MLRSLLTWPAALVALVAFCWATPATAVKYMSLEKAVKTFVPRGSKIVSFI